MSSTTRENSVSLTHLLLSTLQSATSDTELTAALLLLPSLSSLLSDTHAELVWSSLPPDYLSRLAASALSAGTDSPLYARLVVSLLSTMRSSPSVLHSLAYLHYSPLLMVIGYGEGSTPVEVRHQSLECLECVHHIPESHSYLLQANALTALVRGYSEHRRVSGLVLSSLQDCSLFPEYSHQVIDELHTQLSSRGQKEKYDYCEDICALLNAFTAESLPLSDSLLLLLGELFGLMRCKVGANRRLLSVRASSHLLSLYDLASLCQHLGTDPSNFSLNTLLDMLLLLTGLILIDFKLWLDQYMQSGGNSCFTTSLPQLAYARQLLRLLEKAEEDGCRQLERADRCYHFISCSLTAVRDLSVTLMHLLLTASQREEELTPSLSQSVLCLLGMFLSDHELDTHVDMLLVLSPVLVQLLSKVPIAQILAEVNKFDLSLIQDASSFCSFLAGIVDNLTDGMGDFLPAALNFCQHLALSRRLAESGYYQLLLLYFARLYVLPNESQSSLAMPDNRCVLLDIISTLSPHITNLVPADSPVLRLAVTLLLTSWPSCGSSEARELEGRVVAVLIKSVSDNFTSSLPQHLAAAVSDITAHEEMTHSVDGRYVSQRY